MVSEDGYELFQVGSAYLQGCFLALTHFKSHSAQYFTFSCENCSQFPAKGRPLSLPLARLCQACSLVHT